MRSPVFIVGAPRSGTTLLARMLGKHPHLFFGGEVHFFEDVYGRRSQSGSFADTAARELALGRMATLYERFNELPWQAALDSALAEGNNRQRLGAVRDYGELLDVWMSIQAEAAGKKRWGNHAPRDLFHLAEIEAEFPDAVFLACVRDVRGFVASYKNQWRTAEGQNAQRKRALYHPLLTSLLWSASVSRIERAVATMAPRRLLVVAYEALVTDPQNEVQRICTFLGEESCPEMLDPGVHNSSYENAESGIFESSIERWRSELSDEEVFVAQTVAGRRSERLGYDRVATSPKAGRLAMIVATAPFAAIRALRANRGRRAPLLRYLGTRGRELVGAATTEHRRHRAK